MLRSLAYVAACEQGGNSNPAGTANHQLTGINGLCLANQSSLNTAGNPIGVTGCNGGAGQQWSPYPTAPCGRGTAAWTW